MRNASGHQCKEKMRSSEKKNENTYDISSSRAKPRQINVKKKKVCCRCKVAFLLIRPIVVFSPFFGVAFAA